MHAQCSSASEFAVGVHYCNQRDFSLHALQNAAVVLSMSKDHASLQRTTTRCSPDWDAALL
eukprot:1043-Heterococcus_DN1.PRE.2